MLPTFIGIGAQRCGTTWAYENLAAHPDIFVSTPKELRFFTRHYARGLAWYESHFAAAHAGQARGEITPGYVYRPQALERIAAHLPQVRLLLFLRNPIDRAYSAYCFFRDRDYRGLSFRQALAADRKIKEQGLYAASTERLWQLFDAEQCHIVLYDDLQHTPELTLSRMYRFLGVDPGFRPETIGQRRNTTAWPRVQAALQGAGLAGAIELAKRSPLAPGLRSLATRWRPTVAAMDPEDRRRLAQYYAADVARLGDLLDRDLDHWLRAR